ncbi:MAG: hypothetical protein Q7T25_16100 [Sideroxyarcus sp.]|nr:hypothetical protein [Sideroxyarcus sp.]
MNLKPTLTASLFAFVAALSLNVNAAADAPTEVKAEKAVAQKKMKPHSHVEEKTGIPQMPSVAMPGKPHAAGDKTRHFHPRDAK